MKSINYSKIYRKIVETGISLFSIFSLFQYLMLIWFIDCDKYYTIYFLYRKKFINISQYIDTYILNFILQYFINFAKNSTNDIFKINFRYFYRWLKPFFRLSHIKNKMYNSGYITIYMRFAKRWRNSIIPFFQYTERTKAISLVCIFHDTTRDNPKCKKS